MFFINSPLSQFEVTNLIGIFAPIFGQFNIIYLFNEALYTYIFDLFGLLFKFFLNCKDFFTIFPLLIYCGIIFTGVGFFILHSSRLGQKIIKNAGQIGTGLVGFATGLDATLNLAERLKKSGGSGGSGESDPDKDKDKDKEENKDNTENKDKDTNKDATDDNKS